MKSPSRHGPEALLYERPGRREVFMRRSMMSVLVSFAFAAPAFADDVTKEDVLKLARAGVGDGVILAFLDSHQARIPLTSDEVIELTQAGVSERVVRHLLETARPGARPSVAVPSLQRPTLVDDGPRTVYIPTGPSTYSYPTPYYDYSPAYYYSVHSHYPYHDYTHHYETHHYPHYSYSFSPHVSGGHGGHHSQFGGHHGHH